MGKQDLRIGAAAIGTLAICGLLLSPGSAAEAQVTKSNAGDTTRDAPPGVPADASTSRDTRMLVAHALEMAIEGSALQALAMQPSMAVMPASTTTAGSAVGSRAGVPATAGTPGTAGTAGTAGVGAPGTGFTGAPGETVSGRPVTPGTGAALPIPTGARPGGVGAADAAVARPGAATPGGGAPASPTISVASAALLQQHAQRSFEAGERLLGQASREIGTDRGLQAAAARYANTLRSIGAPPTDQAAARIPTAGIGATSPLTPGSPISQAGMISGADLASIALINHAVKEVIGAMKIQQITRSTGSGNGPASQLLLTHASEMETEGRATLRALLAGATAPGAVAGAVGAGAPGGLVPALAQQANDLVAALLGIGG